MSALAQAAEGNICLEFATVTICCRGLKVDRKEACQVLMSGKYGRGVCLRVDAQTEPCKSVPEFKDVTPPATKRRLGPGRKDFRRYHIRTKSW
jgi:hypothetical protein